ncbi:MAG TPA: 6-hydroxymethylpterin diphosphokinase MptE-like protein [Candidatus Ozemobacteraceae bacterium]
MESPFLKNNLKALQRHPHIYALVERSLAANSSASYRLERAKNGLPTLVIESEGRAVTYHSRYDPAGEARRLVEGSLQTGRTHVLVLGYGLGYNLEYVLAELPLPGMPKQVHVVEPDPQVFLLALSCRDLQAVLSDPRVDWSVGATPDEVGERWGSGLDWTALDSLTLIEHPPSMARFHAYFERIKEKVRYLSNRSKGNLVTLMYTGNEFHSNAFANLPDVLGMPGIGRLFDRFAGVPAVIVAAGPSLEKNVHLLSEVRDRYLIIAVDTSFRQLVARGIRPHIVLAADPSYLNSLDFVGVERETEVVLAVEPMTHPDILTSFQGPKLAMTFGGGLHRLIDRFREPTGTLLSWGSIATTAFDLARRCGCDPIVFVGLDLSFQDGRLYARGSYSDDVFYDRVHPYTSLEHETVEYIQTRGVHRIEMPDGTIRFTDENMHIYRAWFEDQFRQTRQKIVNATEGGVVTKYVDCLPFRKVMETWAGSPVPVAGILRELMAAPVNRDLPGLLAHLRLLAAELRRQQDDLRRATALCRKLGGQAAGITPSQLTGPALVQYQELLDIHDHLLDSEELYAWYATHQARFVTRHASELKRLKADERAPVTAWVGEIAAFFTSVDRFHAYQMPLISAAIERLGDEVMTTMAGDPE